MTDYCVASSQYLGDPEVYKLVFHILTCIEIPIHIYGAWCIIFKTSALMRSVLPCSPESAIGDRRIYVAFTDSLLPYIGLSLEALLLACEIVVFLPTISKNKKTPEKFYKSSICPVFHTDNFPLNTSSVCSRYHAIELSQSKLIKCLCYASIVSWLIFHYLLCTSILSIYENRYYILFAQNENHWWNKTRDYFLSLNYLIAVTFIAPNYLFCPDQISAFEIIKTKLPCTPEHSIDDRRIFVGAIDLNFTFFSLTIEAILLFIEIATFFFIVFFKLVHRNKRKMSLMSNRTHGLQTKFVIALCLQSTVPLLLIAVPITYVLATLRLTYHNQLLTNLCVLIGSSHGIVATIVMVLIHKPYRDATVYLCCLVTISIWSVHENRYHVLFGADNNPIWCLMRKPMMLVNYFAAITYFIPPYFVLPDQNQEFVKIQEAISYYMEDCIPSSNDLADPKIYTLIFHIITCLEMPIHAYGAYCILYKTPLQMASVKWIMLYCHVLNALLDLSISLSVPYIFHPTYSGLALGIINFLELQVYIVTSLFALVTVSIWCIYENRYFYGENSLYGENENLFWCNAKKPLMVNNHMSTLLYFVPAFFELPNQDKVFVDLKKILPCNIQQFYDDRKVFILTLDSATPLYCVFFFNLFAVGQCLIFFITTLTKLIRQSRNKALAASQWTLKMRRKHSAPAFL
ncbi:hypothetical protein L5515_006073 [Caenorhabditis briggsae]|uniref:Uncharacterized protein n=1 Tax=Caenorhabditis briggsae TaxID=6238 RepID=A0AAE9EYH8_CAEBR|nr:hypothetical protein L5515_006073 [Caenorhabditis briggsae]